MPFLHGFRRIIFEYQPLVDEILGLLALRDARQSALESPACLGSDRSQLSAVRRVLERETHSPFYQEGVSYALLKVTELGLVAAAEILLEFGADLSFEGTAGGKGAVRGCSLLPSPKTPRFFCPQTPLPTTPRCTSRCSATSRTWWSCWCATGRTSTAETGSMRAVPLIWPARSPSGCRASRGCFSWGPTSTQPTKNGRKDSVAARPGQQRRRPDPQHRERPSPAGRRCRRQGHHQRRRHRLHLRHLPAGRGGVQQRGGGAGDKPLLLPRHPAAAGPRCQPQRVPGPRVPHPPVPQQLQAPLPAPALPARVGRCLQLLPPRPRLLVGLPDRLRVPLLSPQWLRR
ncbi:ankyrin repeat and SOCS box protein 6 isoform X3 [Cygnus atratus]|uniref:ankyrin repeat and SOCS box protein 6 isoform X3 n=1 Tax=Cygnus atratus TaxID=8868 RepID=UPI0021B71426|nr:ankyrin repeat and SOCS box protein 6 isoform X3 [Cygnus atratus]